MSLLDVTCLSFLLTNLCVLLSFGAAGMSESVLTFFASLSQAASQPASTASIPPSSNCSFIFLRRM